LAICLGTVTLAMVPQALANEAAHGDAAAGAQAFLVCSACHNAQPGGAALIGPNLWGVVGRPVASAGGFDYSAALKALAGAWTPEMLDRFLTDPAGFAPGTRMGLAGITDPGERANLIAYLGTLHDGATTATAAPARDFGPDWPPGPGQAEAGLLCDSCHSLTLVKQQKLSRATWDKLLVWMVEEQGMAEQAPEDRELILDYLAEHFGAPE
jgi:cytochrome c